MLRETSKSHTFRFVTPTPRKICCIFYMALAILTASAGSSYSQPVAPSLDNKPDNTTSAAASDDVSAETKQLIKELQDPEKREKLLKKLRLLSEAQNTKHAANKPQEKSVNPLSSFVTSWTGGFLTENPMLGSYIMSGLLVIAVLLLWIFGKCYLFPKTQAGSFTATISAVILMLILCLGLLRIWGGYMLNIFTTDLADQIMGSAFVILVASGGGFIGWQLMNYYVTRRTLAQSPQTEDTRRTQTLLPLFRKIARITIAAIVILIILERIGINIAPLLAGAGVVGIAIGFGAQTLVKDVITGFTFLAENALKVGDWVILGGYDGQVEALSIRHIRLRDIYGNVHVIPWSAVNGVTNQTMEYGYAVFEAGFAYRENIDEVVEVIKTVAAEMREIPELNRDILSDLQILGVLELGDSAIVVRTRFRTNPFRRWFLERDFRRRVKNRFDELGIEIPYPHATVYFGEDKKGSAPPARIELQGETGQDNDRENASQ